MSKEKEVEKEHSDHNDMPIFVLRYRSGATLLQLIVFMWGAVLGYLMCFANPPDMNVPKEIFLRLGGAWVLLGSIFGVIDLIFFKEISLYKDRIVKKWHILGSKEILLRKAKLRGHNYLVRMRKICNAKKGILGLFALLFYSEDFITGISYIEQMATKNDAQTMTRFMAQVTGRDEQEFEMNFLNMNPLIKERIK